MGLTLQEWIINGLHHGASAPPALDQEQQQQQPPLPPREIRSVLSTSSTSPETDDNGQSARHANDRAGGIVSLKMWPDMPRAMLDHFPSVLSRWPTAGALASPASPEALSSLTSPAFTATNMTRVGVGVNWMARIAAARTIADKLHLPLHVHFGSPDCNGTGAEVDIVMTVDLDNNVRIGVKTVTDAEFGECERQLAEGCDGRNATVRDLSSGLNTACADGFAVAEGSKLLNQVNHCLFSTRQYSLFHGGHRR
jgi:hypothetical protein